MLDMPSNLDEESGAAMKCLCPGRPEWPCNRPLLGPAYAMECFRCGPIDQLICRWEMVGKTKADIDVYSPMGEPRMPVATQYQLALGGLE